MIEKNIEFVFQNSNLGSYYGNVGICLYLAKSNPTLATFVLNNILKNIQNLNIDFRNGLTGFVIALQHLKNKGIFNGDINLLINETDTLLFRTIAFDNPQCSKCAILPICGGGCPIDRKNKMLGKLDNLCPYIKTNITNLIIQSLHL